MCTLCIDNLLHKLHYLTFLIIARYKAVYSLLKIDSVSSKCCHSYKIVYETI
jgi:hypothetical protein